MGLVEKCRRGFTTLQPIPKEIYWMTQDQTQHKIENCLHHLLPITRKKKTTTHTSTRKRKKKQREEEEEEKKFLAQNTRFNNNSKNTPQY